MPLQTEEFCVSTQVEPNTMCSFKTSVRCPTLLFCSFQRKQFQLQHFNYDCVFLELSNFLRLNTLNQFQFPAKIYRQVVNEKAASALHYHYILQFFLKIKMLFTCTYCQIVDYRGIHQQFCWRCKEESHVTAHLALVLQNSVSVAR